MRAGISQRAPDLDAIKVFKLCNYIEFELDRNNG